MAFETYSKVWFVSRLLVGWLWEVVVETIFEALTDSADNTILIILAIILAAIIIGIAVLVSYFTCKFLRSDEKKDVAELKEMKERELDEQAVESKATDENSSI